MSLIRRARGAGRPRRVRRALDIGWMVLIFFAAIVAFFLLLGWLTWGTGADLVDWDPAGHWGRKRILDHEDMIDLLELENRERRERGLPELDQKDL
jgi:predicted PurR-regulated permease PerM